MSYKIVTKQRYACHCECINDDGTPCGWDWESDTLPDRCSKCKRRTWNIPPEKPANNNGSKPTSKKKPTMKLPKPKRVRAAY